MKILILLLFVSCGSLHHKIPMRSKFGPENQSEMTGVVKYYAHGADFVMKDRRYDAYKRMYYTCMPYTYEIISEGTSLINDSEFSFVSSDDN